jgi:membrane protein YqaA with SNARE-associated domain
VSGAFLLVCLLLFLDGATIGLATNPIVIAAGKKHAPWLIAVVGGAFSGLGSMVQLWWLQWILSARPAWARRWQPSEEKLKSAIERHRNTSFLALVVMRATPVPDLPLKLVAAWTGYPIGLYGLAVWLGALPYYYLLARIGKWVNPPLWAIAAAFAVLFLAGRIWSRVRRRAT